ncbi:MAG: OB-fold nucleic acid binding domain-containing protein [Bacteroidia bacterium]|jgi:asparaginyl-tRNA synthetase|nr:OB-fold nucleic acid binding domain-containing protein [Bacteroidia bacterium]
MYIKDLSKFENQLVTLKGWVANKRESKGLVFIVLRDGTGLCQCVADANNIDESYFNDARKTTLETSISITGKVIKDEKQIGGYEIAITELELIQVATDYPIAKKEHGVEFLMDHRHLWLRSQRQWAIMRIRNTITFAIHKFFQQEGFIQMDAPLFTGNAVEGTSTLFETDFYGDPAYLSQSGQLYGEAMAMAHNKIYTFGPTFRAEKSKTRRHLSEFWMIEPEMAFHDIFDNMDLIERFLRAVVLDVLANNKPELAMIERDISILENITKPFPRLTYDEAVKIIKGEVDVNNKNAIVSLEEELTSVVNRISEVEAEIKEREDKIKVPGMKKGEIGFNQAKIDKLKHELNELEEQSRNIPQWLSSARNFEYGNDFGGSDETVLTRLFDVPIMVYNWPHEVKAFYLKRDPENSKFARGVDTLAPEGYGEIVGGGERETDLDLLIGKINEHGLPMEAFEWYLDLRRYGSVPHAGFGLGLERLVAWVCKLPHVRETIPFPRMYGRLKP